MTLIGQKEFNTNGWTELINIQFDVIYEIVEVIQGLWAQQYVQNGVWETTDNDVDITNKHITTNRTAAFWHKNRQSWKWYEINVTKEFHAVLLFDQQNCMVLHCCQFSYISSYGTFISHLLYKITWANKY